MTDLSKRRQGRRAAILGLCAAGALACQGPAPGSEGGADLAGGGAGEDLAGGAAADLTGVTAGKFSFFVTSLEMMRELSGSQNGFGGDLRFGEATGLAGADKLCRTIAERSMPGAAGKGWRAFLSASTDGQGGGPVHAIERIGAGPWYDRLGRLVASNVQGLLAGPRPDGDVAIKNDLPNERGEPNKQGTDNHDTLTGSSKQGRFAGPGMGATCNDWTSAVGATGRPMCGHSWPRRTTDLSNGGNWLSDHPAPGCAPGVNLVQNGGGMGTDTVGGGGGYGGIYCFALSP